MYVPFYFISPLMSCFVKCSEHAGALITRLCELQRMRICWGGRPAWPEAGAMQGTIGTGQVIVVIYLRVSLILLNYGQSSVSLGAKQKGVSVERKEETKSRDSRRTPHDDRTVSRERESNF